MAEPTAPETGSQDPEPRRMGPVSRRRLLLAGAGGAVTGAAVLGLGGGLAAADQRRGEREAAAVLRNTFVGTDRVEFHGVHQAGVDTASQAHCRFAAFDLRPDVDREAAGRMLRIITDDIRRITAGRPALGDTAPELATTPARLTVTVGVGPGFFTATGLADRRPAGLTDLPAFGEIDRLDPAYSDGDLLLQFCADDAVTLAHAARMLLKDVRAFATPRWVQNGFLRSRGAGDPATTPRNLMGQVDGTVNPVALTDEFERLVWSTEPGWFTGGTTLVLRRIHMNLDTWDELDRPAMETVIGRNLHNGAPLSGTEEFDEPDFAARDASGLPAIADFAHIRLSRGDGPAHQFHRRPYNYDDTPDADGNSDLGLLFTAYQADIGRQFTPVQQRLADGDPSTNGPLRSGRRSSPSSRAAVPTAGSAKDS